MNKKRAKELRKVAQHYYTRDLDRKGITFKNFYRRFKKEYNKLNWDCGNFYKGE